MGERLDRNKLRKIMELTKSPNDAEALSAIRMANKMLADAGVNWGNFVPRDGAKRAPSFIRPAPTMTIDEALSVMLSVDPMKYAQIARTWRVRKHMSPRDQRLLLEAAEEVRGRT